MIFDKVVHKSLDKVQKSLDQGQKSRDKWKFRI